MKKARIDMTKGHMMPLILSFALPVVFANILQLVYNITDTWVVGNFCNDEALAGIGTSSQPIEIVLCVFMGLGGGVNVMVSHAVGQHDFDKVKNIVRTATTFLYLIAIPLTFIGFVVSPYILRMMQVPAEAYPYALAYLEVIFIGTVANMGYNMNAGILRGLGDSVSSLVFLIVSSIMNIALDLLFTAVLKWGISGIAAATVIAQYVSWISSMVYIRKMYKQIEYSPIPGKINKELLLQEMRIGFPLGFNSSVYSIGHTFMQAVVNMQGTEFAAGATVGTKVLGLATVATTAFSQAAMSYAGQNFGAGNKERLKQGSIRIPLFSASVCFFLAIFVCIFSRPITGFFSKSDNPLIIDYAVRYVWVILPFHCFYAFFNGIINYAHGVGEIMYPTIINIFILWGIRIPAAYILNLLGYGDYCMAAISLSFVCGAIGMMLYYSTKRWKRAIGLIE